MEETEFIWMDGKFVKWKDAKVHVLTHTLHYGLGVFEGVRFYNTGKGPAVFRLNDHTRRLFNSAKKAMMNVPFTEEDITYAILETIRKNSIKEGYIRPIFFYGYGKMGLDPHGAPVNVSVAAWGSCQLFDSRMAMGLLPWRLSYKSQDIKFYKAAS